jgi:splicing factor 3A subunit 3
MIQERAKSVSDFMREEEQLRREELTVIEGQKSLKATDKKKPTDIIWQNFYDKAKEMRYQYKKHDHSVVVPRNTVEYCRENVFRPPYNEPSFTVEESKGKHVDMHEVYNEFLNICKVMEDNKGLTKLHDYLWFLQNMDRFDDFPVNKKIKHSAKYTAYLTHLYQYLADFYQRSRPLQNFSEVEEAIRRTFEEKYPQGKIIGWDPNSEHVDEDQAEYCSTCNKLFISNEAFVGHLMGKRHIKLAEKDVAHDAETEEKERK